MLFFCKEEEEEEEEKAITMPNENEMPPLLIAK